MLDLRNCADCPAGPLLPTGWGHPAAAIDAARREIAEHPERQPELGEVLLHLLEHAREQPAEVAAALAELAPAERTLERAPQLRERFDDWLAEPIRDGGPDMVHLQHLIAAAHLDPAELPRAAEGFRAADPSTLNLTALDYARLGPEQTAEAVAALAELARTAGPWDAVAAGRRLVDFGPQHAADLAALLDTLLSRGISVGLLRPSLAQQPPELRPHLAAAALGSLPLNPGNLLAPRRNDLGADDVPATVLEAGPEYREPVRAALWSLVRDGAFNPTIRHRAAERLGLLGPDEHRAATDHLAAEGVPDPHAPYVPTEPPLDPAAAQAAVSAAWDRIHSWLAAHAPAALDHLAEGLTEQQIADVAAELGFALPADFAASCRIHRAVLLPGYLDSPVCHHDLTELAEWRAAELDNSWDSEAPDNAIRQDWGWRPGWIPLFPDEDGSSTILDLDPGAAGHYGQIFHSDQGLPGYLEAPSWLDVLQQFADELEAGRHHWSAEQAEFVED
ncbi:SMI1/KNR4 family protein [Kitasatospora cineracea]|uniref:SMI1/KNR4 family protein n=1 Tax=Kitasatospora cineracea TaxID=88074 RepID=UPI0038293A58